MSKNAAHSEALTLMPKSSDQRKCLNLRTLLRVILRGEDPPRVGTWT